MSPVELLLRLFDEAYDRAAWQGPNLKAALRGVSAEAAAWRPRPGAHNIRELVLHCAYWKYAARRRLTGGRGEKRGAFGEKGSNWFARRGKADEHAWLEDRRRLDDEHRRLRGVIRRLSPAALGRRAGRSTAARLIYGVAAHDVYHTGQIQLIKRLRRTRRDG